MTTEIYDPEEELKRIIQKELRLYTLNLVDELKLQQGIAIELREMSKAEVLGDVIRAVECCA
jgi:hypothetical protein